MKVFLTNWTDIVASIALLLFQNPSRPKRHQSQMMSEGLNTQDNSGQESIPNSFWSIGVANICPKVPHLNITKHKSEETSLNARKYAQLQEIDLRTI